MTLFISIRPHSINFGVRLAWGKLSLFFEISARAVQCVFIFLFPLPKGIWRFKDSASILCVISEFSNYAVRIPPHRYDVMSEGYIKMQNNNSSNYGVIWLISYCWTFINNINLYPNNLPCCSMGENKGGYQTWRKRFCQNPPTNPPGGLGGGGYSEDHVTPWNGGMSPPMGSEDHVTPMEWWDEPANGFRRPCYAYWNGHEH